MEKAKAYVYTRVSTLMQVDGYSLSGQEERIREYCEHQKIEIVRTYTDKGKSGSTVVGRSEFQKMLSDIEAHKDGVTCVIVFKLSRFGRNAYDINKHMGILKNCGVSLICVDEKIDTSTPMGEIFALIMSALAQSELSSIHEQTILGRRQKALEGKWVGGMAPFGYKLVLGKLEVDEEEAKTVQRIFDLYTREEPRGVAGVVKCLEKEGVRRLDKKTGELKSFTRKNVSDMLTNPTYTGQIAYGRRSLEKANADGTRKRVRTDDYILVKGEHQPIISLEQFQTAQELKKGRSHMCVKRAGNDYVHLLSPMLKCPECGGSLYGSTTRKKKKNGSGEYYTDYHFYACKHRLNLDGKNCSYRRNWNSKDVDGPVIEILTKLVHDPKLAELIQSKLVDTVSIESVQQEIDHSENELATTIRNRKRLTNEQDSIDTSSPAGDIKYSDYQERIENLYVREAEIKQDLAELYMKLTAVKQNQLTKETVMNVLENFSMFFEKMTPADKQLLMRSLVEEIQIYPEKQEDGRLIKSIKLSIPVVYENEKTPRISLDNLTPVECVVKLERA